MLKACWHKGLTLNMKMTMKIILRRNIARVRSILRILLRNSVLIWFKITQTNDQRLAQVAHLSIEDYKNVEQKQIQNTGLYGFKIGLKMI